MTIKYTNKRQRDIQIRENNEWVTRNKKEVIDYIYDRDTNVEEMLNIYEKIHNTMDMPDMDKNQMCFLKSISYYYGY